MSIVHLQQIKSNILKQFQPLIDMQDNPHGQNEDALLSRALAAYVVSKQGKTPLQIAADSVVDGTGDNGIDAIHFDDQSKSLLIVQAKWDKDGSGSVDVASIHKFLHGVRDLFATKFEKFNTRLRSKKDVLLKALEDTETRIFLILAYTGTQPLAREPLSAVDEFLEEINNPVEVVNFLPLNQGSLYRALAEGAQGEPITVELALQEWGQTREPYEAYYGLVSATDIAGWRTEFGDRLFSSNIRVFLGPNEINHALVETLRTEPQNFYYLNNGITALCNSIKKKPLGGSARETGYFECKGLVVVNGAQTVGSIATAYEKFPDQTKNARVFARFISLENAPADFDKSVTRATNTQNRIDNRDFVSLDPLQNDIRMTLQIEGINYVYKSGEYVPNFATGFDFQEAITALACSNADIQYAVQTKREIGRLWEDISKAPYRAFFNPSLQPPRIWNLVQLNREIERSLDKLRAGLSDRERMYCVHGNRLLAHEIFNRLDLRAIDSINADLSQLLESIQSYAAKLVNSLALTGEKLYPGAYLATLFKNTSRCRDISKAMRAKPL